MRAAAGSGAGSSASAGAVQRAAPRPLLHYDDTGRPGRASQQRRFGRRPGTNPSMMGWMARPGPGSGGLRCDGTMRIRMDLRISCCEYIQCLLRPGFSISSLGVHIWETRRHGPQASRVQVRRALIVYCACRVRCVAEGYKAVLNVLFSSSETRGAGRNTRAPPTL